MYKNIWNKLAKNYDKLWVQKYSLAPTRKKTISLISKLIKNDSFSLLDLGCATGQLLAELTDIYPNSKLIGIDKSSSMIDLAKNKSLLCEFFVQNSQNMDFGEKSFDFITCCHSFPYYSDKIGVMKNMKKILKDDGYIILIQASINNIYDKLIMTIVEKTAEQAEYLSKEKVKELFDTDFEIILEFELKEKFFMPTIAGFVMRKRF